MCSCPRRVLYAGSWCVTMIYVHMGVFEQAVSGCTSVSKKWSVSVLG
ncbi:hypothetical protein M6B38_176600 [Iris pallida]|uniref:Uncharacterized protein n=1 Tax=Iris pallida TaxID=29817 RepID=A0AAX6EP02_IRIPA|nr:hypothetical protein M6B38_210540 [Iris pallida]KAJ6805937.1 hypothetical protein M6B38_176600 [Iris pallida]